MNKAWLEYEKIISQPHIRRARQVSFLNKTFFKLTPGDDVLVDCEQLSLKKLAPTLKWIEGRSDSEWQWCWTQSSCYHDKAMQTSTNTGKVPLNPINWNDTALLFLYIFKIVENEHDARFKNASQKEFDGIKKKGWLLPVIRTEVPSDSNFIANWFILMIKIPGTDFKRFRARWLVLERPEKYLHSIAKDSRMLVEMTFCRLHSLSVISFDGNIWLCDIEQTSTQFKALQ